jgi:hypothetical protein
MGWLRRHLGNVAAALNLITCFFDSHTLNCPIASLARQVVLKAHCCLFASAVWLFTFTFTHQHLHLGRTAYTFLLGAARGVVQSTVAAPGTCPGPRCQVGRCLSAWNVNIYMYIATFVAVVALPPFTFTFALTGLERDMNTGALLPL